MVASAFPRAPITAKVQILNSENGISDYAISDHKSRADCRNCLDDTLDYSLERADCQPQSMAFNHREARLDPAVDLRGDCYDPPMEFFAWLDNHGQKALSYIGLLQIDPE